MAKPQPLKVAVIYRTFPNSLSFPQGTGFSKASRTTWKWLQHLFKSVLSLLFFSVCFPVSLNKSLTFHGPHRACSIFPNNQSSYIQDFQRNINALSCEISTNGIPVQWIKRMTLQGFQIFGNLKSLCIIPEKQNRMQKKPNCIIKGEKTLFRE